MQITCRHVLRVWLFALCAGVLVPRAWGDEPKRFIALFEDGTVVHADEVRDWQDPKQRPHIGGRPLLAPNNPARLIRRRGMEPGRPAAYLRMTNGDVLAGKVVRYEPGLDGQDAGGVLVVSVSVPLAVPRSLKGTVRVYAGQVQAVVWDAAAAGDGGARGDAGGIVRYADGREVRVEAVRWRASGLRALDEDAVMHAGFDELASVTLPRPRGEPQIGWIARGDPQRITLSLGVGDGSVFTTPADELRYEAWGKRHERETRHWVQPAWSAHVIGVPLSEIAVWSFRRSNELPLGQLPATTVEQGGATGFVWPWRLNQSVRGGLLTSGGLASVHGIGMHATCAAAFDLPRDARQVRGLVGIDDSVGQGGCAAAAVYLTDRRRVEGKPVWESGFLRGGKPPVSFGPIGTGGKKQVLLRVADAHQGRPQGADPLNIRDQVNWLSPTVALDTSKPPETLAGVMSGGDAWRIVEGADRLGIRRSYHAEAYSWLPTLYTDKRGVVFERRVEIGPGAGLLDLRLGLSKGKGEQTIRVTADGEPRLILGKYEELPLDKFNAKSKITLSVWLGGLKPGPVTIRVHITQNREHLDWNAPGLQVLRLAVRPIIEGTRDGRPIRPDVPLAQLHPMHVSYAKPEAFKPGLTRQGEPLSLWGRQWDGGILIWGKNATLGYKIEPRFRRFVATIGGAESSVAGPFEVRVDGEAVASVRALQAGMLMHQVEVEIPANARELTIVTTRYNGAGAILSGGFMLD